MLKNAYRFGMKLWDNVFSPYPLVLVQLLCFHPTTLSDIMLTGILNSKENFLHFYIKAVH